MPLKSSRKITLVALVLASVGLVYQNCGNVSLQGKTYDSSSVGPLSVTNTSVAGAFNYLCVSKNHQVECSGRIQSPGGTAGDIVPFTNTPSRLLDHEVQMIRSGPFNMCYLDNGDVYCWGANQDGQVGDGTTVNRAAPVKVSGLTQKIIKIGVGYGHACALTESGGVKCWGYGGYGRLGSGTNSGVVTSPIDVVGLESGVTDLFIGSHASCAVQANQLKCWGNDTFITSNPNDPAIVTFVSSPAVPVGLTYSPNMKMAISGGFLLILNDGVLRRWGHRADNSKILGEVVPGFESGVTELFPSSASFCARKSGTVFCASPGATAAPTGASAELPNAGEIFMPENLKCFYENNSLKCQGADAGQFGLGAPALGGADIFRNSPTVTGF